MATERVDVMAVRWVAELSVSPNGLHEIRAGAVNVRERPLVGYASTYELAKGIADDHNRSAAVAELIAATWRSELLLRDMADAGFGDHGPANDLRAALDRVGGAQ